jgi:hypothetical protein
MTGLAGGALMLGIIVIVAFTLSTILVEVLDRLGLVYSASAEEKRHTEDQP